MVKVKKTGIVKKSIKKKDFIENIHNTIKKLAMDWKNNAQSIISDRSVDTGEFVNSIWTETFINKNNIGFTGHDGVKYGIFWEKGTKLHWVPFYRYGDTSQPILADWGHRVLGLSEEEMLKMGGMKVQIPALMPFLKSLLYIQGISSEEFEKMENEFRKKLKHGN